MRADEEEGRCIKATGKTQTMHLHREQKITQQQASLGEITRPCSGRYIDTAQFAGYSVDLPC